MDRTREAMRWMAAEDPRLAARLVLMTLPAAADGVAFELEVKGIGGTRVGDGEPDFRIRTDPRTLAELAAGASPLRLVLGGRLRISGRRRRALRLRALGDGGVSLAEVARAGGDLDPDAVYRSLAYLIGPAWTEGHRFTVAYEVEGSGAGPWYVEVRDGRPVRVTARGDSDGDRPAGAEPPVGEVAARATVSLDTYRALIAGELTPTQSMQRQLTRIEGSMHPLILLGRWIERAQGRDDAELEREARQRRTQERRAGTWGALADGAVWVPPAGQGDPAVARRSPGDLLSYGELYALWERQNWRAHELDFSIDREQWVASPREAQENTAWSLGSFYIGEERVTADLAPFLLAAPSGEVEVFLATQLVDEARHAAFFDRFGAEVMALDSDDLRGRMRELELTMLKPWHDVFDDGLREIALRIKARPDDLDLFVEGIATYHMVIEGVLAMTGQRFITKYMEDHDLYPGFREGFSLVERDEHRHIAFGVRFLKEAVESDPRYGELVRRRVEELVPRAVHVFVPPYAPGAREFVSYGYHSSQIYGYAYRALKRRMAVVGLEVPPPEELMPGPIASPEEARAAGVPA